MLLSRRILSGPRFEICRNATPRTTIPASSQLLLAAVVTIPQDNTPHPLRSRSLAGLSCARAQFRAWDLRSMTRPELTSPFNKLRRPGLGHEEPPAAKDCPLHSWGVPLQWTRPGRVLFFAFVRTCMLSLVEMAEGVQTLSPCLEGELFDGAVQAGIRSVWHATALFPDSVHVSCSCLGCLSLPRMGL